MRAVAAGGSCVRVGRLRGIRVRAREADADADALLPVAMVMAGLVGVVMGFLGTNPSLVVGWLS